MSTFFRRQAVLFACFILVFTAMANGWQRCIELDMSILRGMAYGNHTLFVNLNNEGAYATQNDGQSWRGYTAGVPYAGIDVFTATDGAQYCMCQSSLNIDVYRTVDGGRTWDNIKHLPHPMYYPITTFFVKDTSAYLFKDSILYTASGAMTNWTAAAPPLSLRYAGVFEITGSHIFRASTQGLYRYTTGDSGWQKLAVPDTTCNAMAVIDTTLFVGTNTGVYCSNDSGASWTHVLDSCIVQVLTVMDKNLLVGTTMNPPKPGIYSCSYNGTNWTSNLIIPISDGVFSIVVGDTSFYVCTKSYSPYYDIYSYPKSMNSAGKGVISHTLFTDLAVDSVNGVASDGNNIYMVYKSGMYISRDQGHTWTYSFTTLDSQEVQRIYCLKFIKKIGQTLYTGGADGLFSSVDSGLTWKTVHIDSSKIIGLSGIAADGTVLYAESLKGGIFRSFDNGVHWDSLSGMVSYSPLNTSEHGIYTIANGAIVRSTDSGNTWIQENDPTQHAMSVGSLLVMGQKLLLSEYVVRDTTGGFQYITGKLFQSLDFGNSWTELVKPGEALSTVTRLYSCGPYVFAWVSSMGYYNGCFYSEDTCKTWISLGSGASGSFPGNYLNGCCVSGYNLFVATPYGLYYKPFITGTISVRRDFNPVTTAPNCAHPPTIAQINGRFQIRCYGAHVPVLSVFTLSGKRIPVSFQSTRLADGYSISVSSDRLSKGIYFFQVSQGSSSKFSKKVMMVK